MILCHRLHSSRKDNLPSLIRQRERNANKSDNKRNLLMTWMLCSRANGSLKHSGKWHQEWGKKKIRAKSADKNRRVEKVWEQSMSTEMQKVSILRHTIQWLVSRHYLMTRKTRNGTKQYRWATPGLQASNPSITGIIQRTASTVWQTSRITSCQTGAKQWT